MAPFMLPDVYRYTFVLGPALELLGPGGDLFRFCHFKRPLSLTCCPSQRSSFSACCLLRYASLPLSQDPHRTAKQHLTTANLSQCSVPVPGSSKVFRAKKNAFPVVVVSAKINVSPRSLNNLVQAADRK